MQKRVCLIPKLSGLGGPASFQGRLAAGLIARGIAVTYDPDDRQAAAILVTGGTHDLAALGRAKRRGARVVQRLDGMNWIHRQRFTGVRHFLRSERNNWILNRIRQAADAVVYQSHFVQEWWERVYGQLDKPTFVIYNGVDLQRFTPDEPHARPTDHLRLLVVEGRLGGGNETGLENAVRLAECLREAHQLPVVLQVAGDVPERLRAHWQARSKATVAWAGVVPAERIPELDRSAHLLFSADLHAACPNSVIEALACGLPMVSFDTGALPELVQDGAGALVPYGGNPWKLEPADIPSLAQAAAQILADPEPYRLAARKRAEVAFGLEQMVDRYVEALGT